MSSDKLLEKLIQDIQEPLWLASDIDQVRIIYNDFCSQADKILGK